MKTKAIFILIALATIMQVRFAYGQETNFKDNKNFVNIAGKPVHQQFKSVDICGPASVFSAKLSEKGFTPNQKNDNRMTGVFAGYEATAVYETTPVTKNVYRVTASLPYRATWTNVENDYKTFKENLTLKYGEPKNVIERFWEPYHPGDGYELKALGSNKANFNCEWITPGGQIIIKILGDETKAYVQLIYTDSIGVDKFNKEKEDQFLEDL